MKKIILSTLIVFSLLSSVFCQEDADAKKADKPVRSPWSSGTLIDQQTSYIPEIHSFESVISHRFGNINDISDLYGIYSPGANLRLGFNYVILKNIQIRYFICEYRY